MTPLEPMAGRDDDSEAETERLHESPTKKRLLQEIQIDESHKRVKLAGRDRSRGKAPSEDLDAGAGADRADEADDLDEAEGSGPHSDGNADADADGDAEGEADDLDEDESEADRLKAIDALAQIETAFSKVRDRLHEQQLSRFDLEIRLCADGKHPELEHYHTRINDELQTRLHNITSLLRFQTSSIFAHSRASRCSAIQTFLKNRIEVRSSMINELTSKWYQTNLERYRAATSAPDFGYVAHGKPHTARRVPPQKMGVRTRPTLLNMPVAPSMPQLTDAECEDDLRSLGLR